MRANGEREVTLRAMGVTENEHILYLTEAEGGRVLSIWVGTPNAVAITIGLSGSTPSRPFASDVLLNAITAMGYVVEKVVINDLQNNTYHACIHLGNQARSHICLDSRPSDALALAVRAACPIYVAEELLGAS